MHKWEIGWALKADACVHTCDSPGGVPKVDGTGTFPLRLDHIWLLHVNSAGGISMGNGCRVPLSHYASSS